MLVWFSTDHWQRREMTELLNQYGSFRLLCEAYWTGKLNRDDERHLEDAVPKETLVGFKPLVDSHFCATCDIKKEFPG